MSEERKRHTARPPEAGRSLEGPPAFGGLQRQTHRPERGAANTAESAWRRWLHRPESLRVHRLLFQIHQWAGLAASLYILVLSLSGSAIVFLPQVERSAPWNSRRFRAEQWLANLHENLLLGRTGRNLNGAGAICLAALVATGIVVWWPGTAHWLRSLKVSWKTGFARLNWDLHNALGFWCLVFMALWAISGAYFCFPSIFNRVVNLFESPAPASQLRLGDVALFWLSRLHFGRFTRGTEAVWATIGLVPGILAATGVFMYCHRLLSGLPHPSKHWRFGEAPKTSPR